MASYNTTAPVTRSDAIRQWNRLQRDPDFVRDFLNGKTDALNAKEVIDKVIAQTGGNITGAEHAANVGDNFDDAKAAVDKRQGHWTANFPERM